MSLVVKLFATNQTGLSRASLEERLLYSQPLTRGPLQKALQVIYGNPNNGQSAMFESNRRKHPLPRENKNKNTARTQVCHLVAKRNRKTVGKNLNAARPIQALASTVRGRNIPMSFLNYLYLYICIYIYIKRTCIIDIYVHGHAHIYTSFSSFCMSSAGTGLYLPTSQG